MLTVDEIQSNTKNESQRVDISSKEGVLAFKIDALLHRVQAVKKKTLYIQDEQSTFSNSNSHENTQSARFQTCSDHKELPVSPCHKDPRLDNLLVNELNKLRRFHPLQFPVREWHRATSRVWDLIIKASQQPLISSYPTTQKGLHQTRSKIIEFVTTLRSALRELQYEQLRIIKKIAETPESLQTLQEDSKKLTTQLQLTEQLVSEKNDALEDAMSIIKQLQCVQSSLQNEEHPSKQALNMKKLQEEYDQLNTKYSYNQNQLNEAFAEKKYLLDRLRNTEKALVLSKTQSSEWQQDSIKKHKILVGLENLLEKAGKRLEEFEISDKKNKLSMQRLSEQVRILNREKKTNCLERVNVQYICLRNKKAFLTRNSTSMIAQHHTTQSKNSRAFTTLATLPELRKTYTKISTSHISIHFPKTTLNVATLCKAPCMLTKAVQTLRDVRYESRIKFSQCQSLKINVNSSIQHSFSLFKTIQKSTPIQVVSYKHSVMNFCRTTVQSVQRLSYPLVLTKNFFPQIMIEASLCDTRDSKVSKKQIKHFDDSKTNKNFFSCKSIEIIHGDVLPNSGCFFKRNHSVSTCELSEDVSCVSGTLASSCSAIRNPLPFHHIRFIQNPSPRILPFTPRIKKVQSRNKMFTFQKEHQVCERPTTRTIVSSQSFSQQKELFIKHNKRENTVSGTYCPLSPFNARQNKFSTVINKNRGYANYTPKFCKYKNNYLFLNFRCISRKQAYLKKFRNHLLFRKKKKFRSRVQPTKFHLLRPVQLNNQKMQSNNNGFVFCKKPCISLRTELQLLFFKEPVLRYVMGTQTDFLKQKICLKNPVSKRHSDFLKKKRIKLHSPTKEIVFNENAKDVYSLGKFLTPNKNSPSIYSCLQNKLSRVAVLKCQLLPCFALGQSDVDATFFKEHKEKLEQEYNTKLNKQCVLLEKVVKKRSNLLEQQSNLEIQNWKEKYINREKECCFLRVAIEKLLQKKELNHYTLEQPFLSMKTFIRTQQENSTCHSYNPHRGIYTSFNTPLTTLRSSKHENPADTMDCMSAVLSIEKNIPCHDKIPIMHGNKQMPSKTLYIEQENIEKKFKGTDQEKYQPYVSQVFQKPFAISALPKSNVFLPENADLYTTNKPYQLLTGENMESDLLLNLSRVRQNVSKTFFGTPIRN